MAKKPTTKRGAADAPDKTTAPGPRPEEKPAAGAAPEASLYDFGLVIGLALIDQKRLTEYRAVSACAQKTALMIALAFEGEILSCETIAGYMGCDQGTARSAMDALHEHGYIDREAESSGRAFRYTLNRDAIRQRCEYIDVNRQTDTVSLESRKAAEERYGEIVGVA